MSEFSLELSSQVEKGRYTNFSKDVEALSGVFMMGYEECASDYIIERNGFPFWMLEFVVGGEGSYLQDNQVRRLRHGSIFSYGPDVLQRFGNESDRPFRKYFMASGEKEYPAAWRRAGLEPGRIAQMGNAAPLVSIFDQILDEGAHSDAQTPEIVEGLLQVLLALVARHKGTARGDRSGSRKVYDLSMDILQRDYRSLHSLSDLAERSGYSGEYLCRVFKKYHGESPYQVLLHRKMSAAWLLLREGQLQVGAVARELGYEDQLHFSRIFRKVMGCAPSSVQIRE